MWCPSLCTHILTYLLTFPMEQIPSSASNQFSASQIPRILWNPQDHHCINKFPPPVPILSNLNPLHTPTSHFLKIHLNIMLPSMPGSSKWGLCLRFPPPKKPHICCLSFHFLVSTLDIRGKYFPFFFLFVLMWLLPVYCSGNVCAVECNSRCLMHQCLPAHFLKIHLNIILPSMPGSSKWSLSLRFPHQNPVYSSRFDHLNNTGWGVQIIKSSLFSFLHSPVTASVLGPNILLNTILKHPHSKFHTPSKLQAKL